MKESPKPIRLNIIFFIAFSPWISYWYILSALINSYDLMIVKIIFSIWCSVVNPDPNWICIQQLCVLRIRIHTVNNRIISPLCYSSEISKYVKLYVLSYFRKSTWARWPGSPVRTCWSSPGCWRSPSPPTSPYASSSSRFSQHNKVNATIWNGFLALCC